VFKGSEQDVVFDEVYELTDAQDEEWNKWSKFAREPGLWSLSSNEYLTWPLAGSVFNLPYTEAKQVGDFRRLCREVNKKPDESVIVFEFLKKKIDESKNFIDLNKPELASEVRLLAADLNFEPSPIMPPDTGHQHSIAGKHYSFEGLLGFASRPKDALEKVESAFMAKLKECPDQEAKLRSDRETLKANLSAKLAQFSGLKHRIDARDKLKELVRPVKFCIVPA
jgi:hypothetical protein